jgi:2-oxoisovalerate dehydrogenase E1 component
LHCNGKDVFDSMNAMIEAKRIALEESRPVIIQANCVRIRSHSNSDDHLLYRSESERNYVEQYDPLAKFRRMLIRYNRFTEQEILAIEEEVKLELKAAHKAAMQAPNPDPKSIYDFVLPNLILRKSFRMVHHEQADKEKADNCFKSDIKGGIQTNPDTFMWGQDMANKDKGGIFNVSKGLQQEFGPKRVFNAPIAEDFIVGTANGMSRFNEKIRIVIEGAEFADYFWPAMEQYVECSHDYWRSNGKFAPNITIRLASGGYIGGGLYHSQTIEGSLVSIPGIGLFILRLPMMQPDFSALPSGRGV